MVGDIVEVVALVGAIILSWFVFKACSNRAGAPPEGIVSDPLRQSTIAESETQQKAIDVALFGDDPSGDLADLGNDRRDE